MLLRLLTCSAALVATTTLAAVDLLAPVEEQPPTVQASAGGGGGGGGEDDLADAEQAALYRQLFGAEEAALRGGRAELQFASELYLRSAEEDLAPIRSHIRERIEHLLQGHRSDEALDLQIAIVDDRIAAVGHRREFGARLRDLLLQRARSMAGEEQAGVAARIADLYQADAALALSAGDYQQAEADYRELAAWYRRIRDREGMTLVRDVLETLARHRQHVEEGRSLAARAAAAPHDAEAQRALGDYRIESRDWPGALEAYIAAAAADDAAAAALIPALKAAVVLGSDAELEPAAGRAALAALEQTLAAQRDDLLRRRLLGLGLQLIDSLQPQAEQLDRVSRLKLGILADDWASELEALGPDPLPDLAVLGSSAHLGEAQLLAAGWVQIFDRRNVVGLPPEGHPLVGVVDGLLRIEQRGDVPVVLYPIPVEAFADYRAIKLRFRCPQGTEAVGPCFLWMAKGGTVSYPIALNHGQFIAPRTRSEGRDELPIESGWNDITFRWERGRWQATVNGHDFEAQAVDFDMHHFRIYLRPLGRPIEFQSILALPR